MPTFSPLTKISPTTGTQRYFQTFLECYKDVRLNTNFTDCQIFCESGKRKISVHQSHLSLYSSYLGSLFKSMAFNETHNNPQVTLILGLDEDEYFDALISVIDLIYTGSTLIPNNIHCEKIEAIIKFLKIFNDVDKVVLTKQPHNAKKSKTPAAKKTTPKGKGQQVVNAVTVTPPVIIKRPANIGVSALAADANLIGPPPNPPNSISPIRIASMLPSTPLSPATIALPINLPTTPLNPPPTLPLTVFEPVMIPSSPEVPPAKRSASLVIIPPPAKKIQLDTPDLPVVIKEEVTDDLDNIKMEVEDNYGELSCPVCPVKADKNKLGWHLSLTHFKYKIAEVLKSINAEDELKCIFCSEDIESKDSLICHMGVRHNLLRPCLTDELGKSILGVADEQAESELYHKINSLMKENDGKSSPPSDEEHDPLQIENIKREETTPVLKEAVVRLPRIQAAEYSNKLKEKEKQLEEPSTLIHDRQVQCPNCSEVVQGLANMKQHMYYHYKAKVWPEILKHIGTDNLDSCDLCLAKGIGGSPWKMSNVLEHYLQNHDQVLRKHLTKEADILIFGSAVQDHDGSDSDDEENVDDPN